eukprot:TRINITY_DN3105_c0_g1_i1.p1 TRINITY_DN3105_c0_g1~~TRINITY_DN3105_c0_g1_i1.p1  ORF type:complete len:344 (+),score=100.15 TRINITY_DN3105_c0_g1_i1:86-1117(+)
MADFQKKIDALLDLYLNGHSDEEVQKAAKLTEELFKEANSAEGTVQLYKFLPAALTTPFIGKVLDIERDQLPGAGVANAVQASLPSIAFTSKEEKRRTLLALHECFMKQGKTVDAQMALVDLLSEFEEGEKADGYDLEELAVKALTGHMRSGMGMEQESVSWQFETVLGLPAVVALQKSKSQEHKDLLTFVMDFALGKCAEFTAFASKNKELVEGKWGLDIAALTTKIRLLALCSLCNELDTVDYAKIGAKLGIPEAEVELHVIDAMSAGLINGKIDAMSRTVHVKTAHCPLINDKTWVELGDKLLQWYTQVSTLVTTLDDVRIQQVKEDRESERIEANSRAK